MPTPFTAVATRPASAPRLATIPAAMGTTPFAPRARSSSSRMMATSRMLRLAGRGHAGSEGDPGRRAGCRGKAAVACSLVFVNAASAPLRPSRRRHVPVHELEAPQIGLVPRQLVRVDVALPPAGDGAFPRALADALHHLAPPHNVVPPPALRRLCSLREGDLRCLRQLCLDVCEVLLGLFQRCLCPVCWDGSVRDGNAGETEGGMATRPAHFLGQASLRPFAKSPLTCCSSMLCWAPGFMLPTAASRCRYTVTARAAMAACCVAKGGSTLPAGRHKQHDAFGIVVHA